MTPTADQPSAWQRDRVVPAALALITLVGLVLRLHLYERSLVGDELSTLWIVQNHGLLDTIRLVGTNAEITPPFSFVLSWFSTRLGDAPELVRLPSLIAGVATIPLVYLLGRRTVSIRAGLVGSAVFALSPFVTYFAANGRGYAVLILLLIGSTLTMLRGVESGRAGWWVAYGLLSCLAMYTHYTAAFVLVAQLGWVLVQHPPARLVALAANALAALLYLPWVPKVLDDFDSPTTDIMEALQGSGLGAKRNAFEQWVFGHQLLEPASFPGAAVMIVIGLGLLVAIGGLIFRFASRGRDEAMPAPREGLALVVVIALAAPAMEALLLLTGTDLLGSRNMAPSWYGLAATIGALVTLPGGAVTLVSGALVLGGYGTGAVKLWGQDGNVIAVKEVAEKIDAEARPGDSVVDAFVSSDSPTPLTPLEAHLRDGIPYVTLGQPEGPPPYLPFGTTVPSPAKELRKAFRDTSGRVFLRVPSGVAVEQYRRGGEAGNDTFLIDRRLVLPRGATIESERSFPAVTGSDLYVIDSGS